VLETEELRSFIDHANFSEDTAFILDDKRVSRASLLFAIETCGETYIIVSVVAPKVRSSWAPEERG